MTRNWFSYLLVATLTGTVSILAHEAAAQEPQKASESLATKASKRPRARVITGTETTSEATFLVIKIITPDNATVTSLEVPDPARLVLDFEGTSARASEPFSLPANKVVSTIRFGHHHEKMRVVVDFKSETIPYYEWKATPRQVVLKVSALQKPLSANGRVATAEPKVATPSPSLAVSSLIPATSPTTAQPVLTPARAVATGTSPSQLPLQPLSPSSRVDTTPTPPPLPASTIATVSPQQSPTAPKLPVLRELDANNVLPAQPQVKVEGKEQGQVQATPKPFLLPLVIEEKNVVVTPHASPTTAVAPPTGSQETASIGSPTPIAPLVDTLVPFLPITETPIQIPILELTPALSTQVPAATQTASVASGPSYTTPLPDALPNMHLLREKKPTDSTPSKVIANATNSAFITPSSVATVTTATATVTTTATATVTVTVTATATATATATLAQPTATATKTATASPTPTKTPTPSATPTSPPPTRTPSLTPSLAPSPIATRTPTAPPTPTLVPITDFHLTAFRFDYLEPGRVAVLKLVLDKTRPQAQISKIDQKTYVIEIANCSLIRPGLALPQYPPAEFKGFLLVSSTGNDNRLTVTINVDAGTTLGTFVRNNEIWVKQL